MVSLMYQSVIQHLWLMDSISEHIDVALYTEGQIRSNKALIQYIKFWMIFNVFSKGGRYHFRTHFRTQKRNSCQNFWVLRPPLVNSILETIFGF